MRRPKRRPPAESPDVGDPPPDRPGQGPDTGLAAATTGELIDEVRARIATGHAGLDYRRIQAP